MVANRNGDQLNTDKTIRMFQAEVKTEQPDIVICIRDVDGLRTQVDKIKDRHNWYEKLTKGFTKKKLLLLNIYELEALILANIDVFNTHYGTSLKFPGDVAMQTKPKEWLIRQSRKHGKKTYTESDCPTLFKGMDLPTVRKRCTYFNEFATKLEALL